MLSFDEKIDPEAREEFGAKTRNLRRLMDQGVIVPRFVAVAARHCVSFFDKKGRILPKKVAQLTEEIRRDFPQQFYAVRSSALIEDERDHSLAGQFKTVTKVAPAGLEAAITEVLKDAFGRLKNSEGNKRDAAEIESSAMLGGQGAECSNMRQFSLLIQDYVKGTYSGLTFTRNPLGGREMVIEYQQGSGESLVGGEVKPEQLRLYWHQDMPKDFPIRNLEKVFLEFQRVEEAFFWPQDIEWTYFEGLWYFLQARPITTISEQDFEGYRYLDATLSRGRFYLEKNEISEIAPRPTTFTFDLLKRIYAENGPVARVYERYGFRIGSQAFLKIIGNELYIDKIAAQQSLLPAYDFDLQRLKPKWAHLKGSWRTLRNIFANQRMSGRKPDDLAERLQAALEAEFDPEADFARRLEMFLEYYELVFEVNTWAYRSVSMLKVLTHKFDVNVAELLDYKVDVGMKKLRFNSEGLMGNCLEIADEEEFFAFEKDAKDFRRRQKDKDWFVDVPEVRRAILTKALEEARAFNQLREYGRWLTVKLINYLRQSLMAIASRYQFADRRLIYFATILEILNDKVFEARCEERRKEYEHFLRFEFPAVLLSEVRSAFQQLQGVSFGKAQGMLVNEAIFSDKKKLVELDGQNLILYTKTLRPELTKYFSLIKGILSEQGAVLSHLAIMAREYGLPVLVGVDLKEQGLAEGDLIEMDVKENILRKL